MTCDKCKFVHSGLCEIIYTSDGFSYLHIDDDNVGVKNGFELHDGYYTRVEN